MVSLNNQRTGGIPSKCETGTRALICLANCYGRILLGVGIAPSHPGARLPKNGDIAPATDLIVLIVRLFMGDMLWRCFAVSPTAYRVLG
jgi:hypothetical protein